MKLPVTQTEIVLALGGKTVQSKENKLENDFQHVIIEAAEGTTYLALKKTRLVAIVKYCKVGYGYRIRFET